MPVFRPSCVVNLKLLFDESLTLEQPAASESVDARVASPTPVGGAGGSGGAPLILREDAGRASWVMARVPKALSYEKPGYRQAGRFNATFAFRDLPIDPRTVRAAAVEIHTGTVGDDDFAEGVGGGFDARGRRLSVLQTRTEAGLPNAATLRMVAMVDEWRVSHGRGGEVTMSGRDLRGVLLDTPVSPAGGKGSQFFDAVDMSRDIQTVVYQILTFNPFFDEFEVVANPADWPGGKLPSPGAPEFVPRHRRGARGQLQGGRATPPSTASAGNLNFWDMVVRVCYLVGAVPYFHGTRLIIRPAQTVFDKLRGPVDPVRNPTPFAGGAPRTLDVVSGGQISPGLRARRLVYGRDVEQLQMGRKYGGWKRPKVVRAVAVDHSLPEGKVVMGVWPPQTAPDAKRTRRSPGQEKNLEEVVNIPVPGVVNAERLVQIARAAYEEMGRGELSGDFETKSLASFGGDNADPDLLTLDPGDGVELLADTRAVRDGAPLVSSFTDYHRVPFEQAVAEVSSRIGDRSLARAIIATARGQVAELQRFFRVETVKFSWDASSGAKVSADFHNYVVARAQVEQAPLAPGAAVPQRTPGASTRPGGRSMRSL